jgi:hypothetical protein
MDDEDIEDENFENEEYEYERVELVFAPLTGVLTYDRAKADPSFGPLIMEMRGKKTGPVLLFSLIVALAACLLTEVSGFPGGGAPSAGRRLWSEHHAGQSGLRGLAAFSFSLCRRQSAPSFQ